MKTLQETLLNSIDESILDDDGTVTGKMAREVAKYYNTYIKDLKLGDKIKTLSKDAIEKLGKPILLKILELYYLLIDSSIEVKDKMMIVSALIYLVSPIDALPDATVMGFTDDVAVITYIFSYFSSHITPDIKKKSEDTFNKWFEK